MVLFSVDLQNVKDLTYDFNCSFLKSQLSSGRVPNSMLRLIWKMLGLAEPDCLKMQLKIPGGMNLFIFTAPTRLLMLFSLSKKTMLLGPK